MRYFPLLLLAALSLAAFAQAPTLNTLIDTAQRGPDPAARATAIAAASANLDYADYARWRMVLEGALADPDAGVRAGAVESLLALFHDAASRTRALKLLDDPAPAVRARALDAVSVLSPDAATARLEKALTDPDAAVRIAAGRLARMLPEATVLRLAQVVLADADSRVAAAFVGDTLPPYAAEVTPALLRQALLHAAPRAEGAQFISVSDRRYLPVAKEALAAPRPETRAAAVDLVGQLGPREAVPELIACLKDASADVRERAVVALSRTGDSAAGPGLAALMRVETLPAVRLAVAKALAICDAPESRDALVATAEDKDMAVRVMALRGLAWLRDPRMFTALLPTVREADLADGRGATYDVVDECLLTFNYPMGPTEVAGLVPSLEDPDPRVRLFAGSVLAFAGDPRGATTIAPVLSTVLDRRIISRLYTADRDHPGTLTPEVWRALVRHPLADMRADAVLFFLRAGDPHPALAVLPTLADSSRCDSVLWQLAMLASKNAGVRGLLADALYGCPKAMILEVFPIIGYSELTPTAQADLIYALAVTQDGRPNAVVMARMASASNPGIRQHLARLKKDPRPDVRAAAKAATVSVPSPVATKVPPKPDTSVAVNDLLRRLKSPDAATRVAAIQSVQWWDFANGRYPDAPTATAPPRVSWRGPKRSGYGAPTPASPAPPATEAPPYHGRDARVLTAIRSAAKDPDAGVRSAALDVLLRVADPAAIPALCDALNDPALRDELAFWATVSQGHSDARLLPVLRLRLRQVLPWCNPERCAWSPGPSSYDSAKASIEDVAALLARAIGKQPGGVEEVQRMADSTEPWMRIGAAMALNDTARMFAGVQAMLIADRDPNVRLVACLSGNAESLPEAAIEPLRHDADPRIRLMATFGLFRSGYGADISGLVGLLDDADPGNRINALRALAMIRGRYSRADSLTPAARQRIADILRTGTPEEQVAAARALAAWGDTASLPVLREAATSPLAGVRAAAIMGLGKLKDAAAHAIFLAALDDPDDRVAAAAVSALRESCTDEAAAKVMRVLLRAYPRLGEDPEGEFGYRRSARGSDLIYEDLETLRAYTGQARPDVFALRAWWFGKAGGG